MADTKTFTGSCHCHFMTYTVSLPAEKLKTPEATRCNCTICSKTGYTSLTLDPSDFKLTSPSSKSEVTDYPPPTAGSEKMIHHYLCPKCGVHIYGEGSYVYEGNKYDFFSINLATVDQPQEGIELSDFKMKYVDGLTDNWMAGSKDVPWKGGLA